MIALNKRMRRDGKKAERAGKSVGKVREVR